jgi:Protein of unknown function (DUF1559)
MRSWLTFSALVVIGSLAAAPVPKDKDKEEAPGPITDGQLQQSQKNLKLIGLAIHNFESTHGVIPNNVTDGDGKPTLSWRVHLLPYLEQDELYKQFNLDEPWDGKTNKKLVEQMPAVFAPVRMKPKQKGVTFYRGFAGEGTTFEPGQRITFASFTDGMSNTIGVIEAGEPCIWTKPDDLPFDPKKDVPKLGGEFDGAFHVLLMDGSVQKGNAKKVDADMFKLLVQRNDGRVIVMESGLGQDK